jgi:hypothetical protein
MNAINTQYTREVRNRFGYSATWAPTLEIRLGDVGRLQDYEFEPVTSLADLGLPFGERAGSATASLDYTSAQGVSFAIKAAGELPPLGSGLAAADVRIVISFNAEHAIVLQAAGCVTASIDDQRDVGERILARYESGEWDEDYVVVTEVMRADRTTVLISSSNDGSVAFRTKASVELGPLSLASADVDLHITRSSNIGTQIVAAGALTPLFRAYGVRKRWLRPAEVVRRGEPAPSPPPNGPTTMFDEVDYEDFG